MTDYIIIGSGLAGIAFAETALRQGKTILVFDNDSQTSSHVAGGLFNPVILKRFSKLAHAQQQLIDLHDFYTTLESRLNVKVYHPKPILRKFHSAEEHNNWFHAADKPGLSDYLSTTIVNTQYQGINSSFGYGEVLQAGYVDVGGLLLSYRKYLKDIGAFENKPFDYDNLKIADVIHYQNLSAAHIVFAEGYGIHANPLFNYLPLEGTKGELFIIRAPGLVLDVIDNAAIFILPLGNDLYKVGATYHWTDKTNLPTDEGRDELLQKISEVLNCNFEVIEHYAGVRPTVKDRKPLLGTHPEHKNVHVMNGLGTRGVMLGPYMAKELFNHIEHGHPLAPENDINRFRNFYPGTYRNS